MDMSVAQISAVVESDSQLKFGGPRECDTVRVRGFKAGERLSLREVTDASGYPRMFIIDEYPELGALSRKTLAQVLPEFDAPPYTKPGS